MAYATGTGAGQQDFLDAISSFASGLGWSIDKWDTSAKLLYLSKGVCKVCFEWLNANISVFNNSTTSTTFSEGQIRGTLVSSIDAGSNSYWTFPGSPTGTTTTNRNSGPLVYMSNVQGSFVGWHLFSNAAGDYIHAMLEVTPGVYGFLGFGIADSTGLSHSGAAYLFSDGLRYWYDTHSNTNAASNTSYHYFNKPSATASFCGTAGGTRSPSAQLHLLCVDALPAGFSNNQCLPNYGTTVSTHTSTTGRCGNIGRTKTGPSNLNSPQLFVSSSATVSSLLESIITMRAPDYSTFVPMMGVPLIGVNDALTLACVVGMMPDIRVINLQGLSPQQELSLGDDVWKVFPQLRQADWVQGMNELLPSSGQFGLAFKKI